MANGKLYVSGEYAVVDGGAAIIAAVNRSLTCALASGTDNRIIRDAHMVPQLTHDDEARYVKAASYIAHRYLDEIGKAIPQGAKLDIRSELVETDGRKYGLGSSGAVTVAVLECLLAQYELERMKLYKLAVLALLIVGDNGSFGDIACSSFGTLIYYVRPGREFLQKLQSALRDVHTTVHELLEKQWDGLRIESLAFPQGLNIQVGWTGNPASSTDLVNAVRGFKQNRADDYASFCKRISAVSDRIRLACTENNPQDFIRAYRDASCCMSEFSEQSGGFAETEKLCLLKVIAQAHGYEAKFSGAGGGDCGIAIGLQQNVSPRRLKSAWEDAGIMDMNWELL